MGGCLSKKKGSSTATTKSAASSTVPELKNNSPFSVRGVVNVSKPNVETETGPEVTLKKDNSKKGEEEKKHETVPPEPEGHVKKEIFIIKHRKSHDDNNNNRDRNNSNSKSPPFTEESTMCDKTVPTANMGGGGGGGGVGVRTSSCTKEEVDAILIQCGRLSRSSSGNAIAAEHKRRYSGSKRSYDFDHCDNDTVSNDDDSKQVNANESNSDLCEEERHQHRPRHRQSPSPSRRPSSSSCQERRRRTPSREREQQQQRSSSRERRVSRSPGRRSSENTTPSNARNNNSSNNTSSRPGKMVSVPATVSSLVMDKSNNNGSGESGATTGIKRIAVKRNVGAASPRSQSPARANGNGANGNKAFSENQQQPSLSRSNSRKAEQSPYKRNPLSEIEPNSLAFPHSTTNNSSSRVQNRPKKEFETEANQKTNGNRTASDKGVTVNCKTKVQQEEDVKVHSSITDNVVVKTMVPPGVDNLKPPYTLTRSRSSRRSRELDINSEALLNPPPQSYASLLLEDIQNFHQKNTPPVSLPACVTKACSILEAVADLNSNAGLNFCGAEDRRSPLAFQCSRNDYNVPLTTNDYGKREPDAEDPVVESMLVFNDDDVMEPNLHKYVTVNRGGSLGGVDMDDQESSGSNSFTVSSGQRHWGVSSSSWEPSSVESKDCWTSRSNYSKEQCQKSPLGLEGMVASEVAGRDAGGAKKKLNSQRRECDHQHGSGIGRGRLGANKVLYNIPVVTAAAST